MPIDQDLTHADPIIRRNAFRSAFRAQVTSSVIEMALTDPAYFIRADAINIVVLTPKNYARALRDQHPKVRAQAVRSSDSLTQPQIAEALTDASDEVRCAAAFIPQLTEAQRAQVLSDPSPAVRASAVKAGRLTPAQHAAALADADWVVRIEAVHLSGLTQVQLDVATSDDSAVVRAAAKEMGGKSNACGVMKDAAYRLRCLVS